MGKREVEPRQLRELSPVYFNQSFSPFVHSNLIRLQAGWQASVEKPALLKTSNVEMLPLRFVLKEVEPVEPEMIFQIEGVAKFLKNNGFLMQTSRSLLSSGGERYEFKNSAKEYLKKLIATVSIPPGEYVEGGVYKGFIDQDLFNEGTFVINSFFREGLDAEPSPLIFPAVDIDSHRNLSVQFFNHNISPIPRVYENTIFDFNPTNFGLSD